MDKKKLIIILSSIVFAIILIGLYIHFFGEKTNIVSVIAGDNSTISDNSFDYKIIHKVNEGYDTNYLISPLSIGYAFSMLNEGAKDNSKKQIDEVLSDYNLLKVNNVKDRIGVANALFINNNAKKDINKDYIDKLESKYGAEIIFDKFSSPKNVNDWVNKKTFKMIPITLDHLDPSVVLVLVNTVAINLEWEKEFKKDNTHNQEFTKIDGNKIDSAMMRASNDVKYIKSDKAQGIIKNYKTYDDSSNLEYIAILPEGDIKEYVSSFDNQEYETLLSSQRNADGKSLTVNYNLPKYNYDFKYENIKKDLYDLGIKDVFGLDSNLKGISENLYLYVDEVVHKTHIEVEEKGTKAAAVTAITVKNFAAVAEEHEVIDINFDKPFVYIIRDRKYKNIWFFGVVYEPMKWEDNK